LRQRTKTDSCFKLNYVTYCPDLHICNKYQLKAISSITQEDAAIKGVPVSVVRHGLFQTDAVTEISMGKWMDICKSHSTFLQCHETGGNLFRSRGQN